MIREVRKQGKKLETIFLFLIHSFVRLSLTQNSLLNRRRRTKEIKQEGEENRV